MAALITYDEAVHTLELQDTQDAKDKARIEALIEGVTAVIEREVGAVAQREQTFEIRRGGCEVTLPEQNVIELLSGVYARTQLPVDITGMEVSDDGILRNIQGGNLPLTPWTLTAQVGMTEIPQAIRRAANEALVEAYAIALGPDTEAHKRPFLISHRTMVWLEPYRVGPGIA